MKKALIVGLVGAVALVVVAKKTCVVSYVSTAVSQAQAEAQSQIPTKFEIDRIRHEIANMDGDVTQMIRPVAEHRADIEMLRRDIARGTANIDEQKKRLLAVAQDLEANPKGPIFVGNRKFRAADVQAQLERDTAGLKRIEAGIKTKQRVLEAKEISLKATQEQLAKLVTKKREYELRLAQLESEAETLRVAQIATDVKFDSGRASQIETALKDLERRLIADKEAVELYNNRVINLQQERTEAPADLNVIRNYLEGNDEPTKTATK
jgi:chromosome segregation ATPase